MLEALNGNQDRGQGMGFLPAAAPAAAAAGPAGPIILAIGAIGGIAASLFQGASARKRDEIASGVWLEQSVDAINEIEDQVKQQNITKAEAEKYFKQALDKFKSLIVTLRTKSVVESRINNQTRDLTNLFKSKMAALPDVPECAAGQGRWPASHKCVPLQCPQGTLRNQLTGECDSTSTSTGSTTVYQPQDSGLDLSASSDSGDSGFLWLLLFGAGALFFLRRR